MPVLRLRSAENEDFEVDYDIMMCSNTLKTMCDTLGFDEDDNEPIRLAKVNSRLLRMVIAWATYHRNDPPFTEDEDEDYDSDDMCQWDREFVNVELKIIIALVQVANYLDIKGLLDLTCKAIANKIRGRTVEQMRETFNLENDFTAEELERIRLENEYVDEERE